jgi:hypothetical protein
MQKVIKVMLIVAAVLVLAVVLLLTALAAYVVVKKPFGIELQDIERVVTAPRDDNAQSSYDHPLLNESQERALESIGVDVSTLPTGFTPEQAACAEEKLGSERIEEILSGSSITPADYFKARSCVE